MLQSCKDLPVLSIPLFAFCKDQVPVPNKNIKDKNALYQTDTHLLRDINTYPFNFLTKKKSL